MITVTKSSTWFESILREVGIRKSLIMYGNISDLCFNPYSNKYDFFPNVLNESLLKKGFQDVVYWDRVHGIDYSRVKESSISDLEQLYNDGSESDEDDYLTDENIDTSILSNKQNDYRDPIEFFSLVYESMRRDTNRKVAFVIDWSNYLFGNANALSEIEREYLTILGKSIRQSPLRLDSTISEQSNIVIFLTEKLGAIPPSYYQQNSSVKQIQIPFPSRSERQQYVMDHFSKLETRNLRHYNDVNFSDFIDLLDGFSLRDIYQLIKLSRQLSQDNLTFEKLVNVYKYGKKSSPWEELSKQKLIRIQETLKERVRGQDNAISKVEDVIIRAYTGFSGLQHSAKQSKPKGILFFVGPTGVGKTELAKALAEFLFGDENACIRFDMSEFNHEHSDQRLIGAPPGYTGYEEGGQLTNAIREKPFSVLLFDEIEKAHQRILDKFLQVLEDGRLTDGKGETVYFSESIIIFTSNIGASKVDVNNSSEENNKIIRSELQDHFLTKLNRPELLNRIGDNIVVFDHINDRKFLIDIAKIKIKPIKTFIAEKYQMEFIFEDEDKALAAIVAQVDISNGGRGVLNVIEPKLVDPLARFIFQESDYFAPGKKIKVIQAGNTAYYDFELEDD
ncbi:AAA family ATPase [Neobacillus sp. PS3-34]|uniref:AAA family ATPase n=1 Tax=Neobacillus sp. PS3-34 TaxID=3070678 RepID=UPI0027DF7F48|nr:AAA family ATPase [Neobacillus sp. PS3-34]WML49148.1 AAA family ATPase [Neobacillus sp. PS3-34]